KTVRNPRFYCGADGGTRTLTGLPPRDFKSLASTIPPRPRAAVVAPRGCPAKPCLTAPPARCASHAGKVFSTRPRHACITRPDYAHFLDARDVRQDDPAPYRSASVGRPCRALRSCARSSPLLGSEQPKFCG